jgi:hypothetical protein
MAPLSHWTEALCLLLLRLTESPPLYRRVRAQALPHAQAPRLLMISVALLSDCASCSVSSRGGSLCFDMRTPAVLCSTQSGGRGVQRQRVGGERGGARREVGGAGQEGPSGSGGCTPTARPLRPGG